MHISVILHTHLGNKVGQVLSIIGTLHYGLLQTAAYQRKQRASYQTPGIPYKMVLFILNVRPPPARKAHATDTTSTRPCTYRRYCH